MALSSRSVCLRPQNWHVCVAPAFRREIWNQADARLKAGATQSKTEFSRTRRRGSAFLIGQTVRDVLPRVRATTDGDHNILLAIQHIGHWRSALDGRHQDRPHLLASLLVVSPQHRAPRMLRRRRDLWIAHDN